MTRVNARPAALTLDAAGTLVHPAEPIAATYCRIARGHGHAADEPEVAGRLRTAMGARRALRQGDPGWWAYWRAVVHDAIGVDDAELLDGLYAHFLEPRAWTIAPGARACLDALARAGIRLAVISNWDTRLRPLLGAMDLARCFDVLVVSGELGIEKPDPRIFAHACRALGVEPARCVHVGDRREADVDGARAAGLQALWYGHDVRDFDELREIVLAAPG